MSNSIDSSVNQRFSSRFGLILTTLGVAVGTGNIWRFPRIVAQSGGEEGAGAFLIAWIIFLFVWSIPLIITEYLLGRKFRSCVITTFSKALGEKFSWAGGFVAFVSIAISFFYAVIVGWCIYYFGYLIFNPLPVDTAQSEVIWNNFQNGPYIYVVHALAVIMGSLAIWKGINSIEKVCKILIPSLFVIIIICVIRALTLPGAANGISYILNIDLAQLGDPNIWLNALTQNAWDTGAGWGLFMAYAAYMTYKQNAVKNAFVTAIGNNTVSLLAAFMIFGTVFSVLGNELNMTKTEILNVMKTSGPASTGLTFIWMPQLFAKMFLGKPLAIIFFLGLIFASLTSLISMYELSTRILVDSGIKRKTSIMWLAVLGFLLGIPSSMNLNFLSNQDFVWGVALMISGALVAIAALKYGIQKIIYEEIILHKEDINPGLWWKIEMRIIVPLSALILLIWWLSLSATVYSPDEWYNPFSPFSVMTCLSQWGIIIILLLISNNWINKKLKRT